MLFPDWFHGAVVRRKAHGIAYSGYRLLGILTVVLDTLCPDHRVRWHVPNTFGPGLKKCWHEAGLTGRRFPSEFKN